MKNRSVSLSVLTTLFIILVIAASNPVVRAQSCTSTSTWNAGSSSWFTSGNWTPSGTPSPSTTAYINNGGQAAIQGGSVDATACTLILGNNQGDSGAVVIDTDHTAVLDLGTSACRGDIYVGNRGSGTLSIADTAYIRCGHAYVAAVQNATRPASNGYVKVEGSGTIWHIYQNTGGDCTAAGLFISSSGVSSTVGGEGTVDVFDGGVVEVYRPTTTTDPAVLIGASGTLMGNGTLKLDEGVSSSKELRCYGTIAPGHDELTVEGIVNLKDTANMIFNVTPTTQDKLYVSNHGGGGTAHLDGRITVNISGTFSLPQQYTLVTTDGGLGGTEFASYSYIISGGCIAAAIDYPLGSTARLTLTSTCL